MAVVLEPFQDQVLVNLLLYKLLKGPTLYFALVANVR